MQGETKRSRQKITSTFSVEEFSSNEYVDNFVKNNFQERLFKDRIDNHNQYQLEKEASLQEDEDLIKVG